MRKSVFLVAIAILAAFGSGFWLGRARPAASAATPTEATTASYAELAASSRPGKGSSPSRDYASEDAIAARAEVDNASDPSLAMPSGDAGHLPPVPPRPASPAENRLLGAHGLRASVMQNVLMNPHFAQVVDALDREASADSLEMTRLFRERLSGNLKPEPRFQIERMACGAHLCVVIAQGPVDQDETFADLMMAESKGPKWYAAMPRSLPPQGNATTTEYRVVFTIDPKYNSFEVNQ